MEEQQRCSGGALQMARGAVPGLDTAGAPGPQDGTSLETGGCRCIWPIVSGSLMEGDKDTDTRREVCRVTGRRQPPVGPGVKPGAGPSSENSKGPAPQTSLAWTSSPQNREEGSSPGQRPQSGVPYRWPQDPLLTLVSLGEGGSGR